MIENKQGGFNEAQIAEEEEINLVEILMKYLHYWKWLALSATLFVVLGGIYLKTQNKLYQIDTTILLNDEKGKGRADMAALQEMGILSGTGANVDNEIEVMRSKDLMLGVVNDLKLYTTVREPKGLRKVNIYKKSPVDIEVSPELLDRLRKPFCFTLTRSGEQFKLEGKIDDESVQFQFTKFPFEVSLPLGKLTLNETAFHASSEWEQLEITLRNPMQVASDLTKEVSFQLAQKNGSVVRISMRNENIHLGEDILNKVVEHYNKETMSAKNETAMSTERFINDRLTSLQRELSVVEKNVEGYKKSNKLTNIEAESGLFIEQTGEVDKQRADIETQLNILTYIDEFVNKKENRYRIVPNIGINDPGLLKVIDEYNKLLMVRDRTLRSTSEDNPTIITLNSDINTLRANILGGIDVVTRSLRITQKEILKKENQISGRIKEVPRQERELMEIARQQKIKEGLYMFLLEKREENSLSMTMTVPMARLIEKPYCNGLPVAPRTMVILMASFLLGLIVPIAVIFVKTLFNITINDRQDVESLSKLPILGELCHETIDRNTIIVKESSTSVSNELFRSIRNNLQFIAGMNDKKVITITSNIPGEGKSFVSSNISASFALTKKKVILLGLDLRNPQLANVFGIENTGITNYLSGQTSSWKELIVKHDQFSNFDIIPAGPVPLNPNEMILSSKLTGLIEELKKEYDYIFIDSAPVGVISDTFLLKNHTDLFIFVCRAKYTNKKLIEDVNRMVKEGQLHNAYFVVNDVDMQSKTYRYGRYGYGYGYGKYGTYGYGERNTKGNKKSKKA